MNERSAGRLKRHRRIRKRVAGVPTRPRLAVFRSNKHLYAQVVNDMDNKPMFGCSTTSNAFRKEEPRGATVAAAQRLGTLIATEALKRGVKQVVFDRGGYHYHGRVKALAEAARAAGLDF